MLDYIIIFFVLFAAELAYLRLARRRQIRVTSNERSSHRGSVVVGGGIVFYLSVAVWFVWSGFMSPFFFAGLTLLAFVSFVDDIRPVGVSLRLGVQIVAAALIARQLLSAEATWAEWAVAIVLAVGFMNTFNFMDGINGSLGLYSLVVLCSLWYVNSSVEFIDSRVIGSTIVASLVFSLFNCRGKALCFAGDVGAVVVGAVVFYILGALVEATGNFGWFVLVAVYGTDAALTLLRRAVRGQNVFQAHRMHAYQISVNERGIPHLLVSSALCVLQVCVDIPALFWNMATLGYFAGMLGLLTLIYICIVLPPTRGL